MSHPVFRFGDYRVDPLAREVHRGDELLSLSPKVFDCLVYLIEHRDRAVGRDELIAAVWGKVDVTDTLLGQTLLKARRAVGDDGNEQNAIRTIPRFGYRWIGELVIASEPSTASDTGTLQPASVDATDDIVAAAHDANTITAESAPPTIAASNERTSRSEQRARYLPTAIAIVALLVLPIVAYRIWHAHPDTSGGNAATAMLDDAVVVLPAIVATSEEWGWLRLGLMDLIATRLRHGGQAVIPSDNVVALLRASGPDKKSPNAMREATGARYIVEPQVARNGREWQVVLELRTADGDSREVQTQGHDPIEAARTAGDRLLVLLGKSPAADHDNAGELSLAELQQRTEAALLGDDFVSARRLIESAPAALRATPQVRLRLAQIEYRTGQLDAARTSLSALLSEVSAETDPVLRARALYTLGAVCVREDRNADGVRAFEEAIALTETRNEPAVLGQAYTGLAAALVNLGRHDEAANDLARARIALALAGDSLALARVDANEGVLDNARGRHAEALPILQRAAERFRRFGALNDLSLTVAAEVKAHLALLDAAAALAASEAFQPQRGMLANPRSRNSLDFQRARALVANGRLADARSLLDEIERGLAADSQAGLPGDVASERSRLHLATGNVVAAADAARTAVAQLPTFDEARERARAWLTLCRALRAANRASEAATQTAGFVQWARAQSGTPSVSLFATLAEAEQAWIEHRREDAYRSYAAALGEAERWAVPMDLVAVASSYGASLIADHELDRASAVIGRVARWADQDFDSAVLQARLYRALGQTEAWQAALTRARALAGERSVPPDAVSAPAPAA
jgi:DNA-binding winged helix-turn-helix (wHTH) protein/tetratricopeptide (TPR) repeat protein